VRNLRKWIWLIGIAALMLGAVPINVLAARHWKATEAAHGLTHVLKGDVTARLGEDYNRNFPLRQFAIDLYGSLSFMLFKEGRAGVVVGDDGWLYTSEEFQTASESAARLDRSTAEIVTTVKQLEQASIKTIVLLVPAKARIYPEKLGAIRWPREPSERYERVLDRLRANGVVIADPRDEMQAAKASGDIFLKTDTHWTPYGAAAAARSVTRVAAVQDLGEPEPYAMVVAPGVEHKGDLTRYIPVLPMLASLTPSRAEIVPQVDAQREASKGAASLFGEEAIPVALIGTSYSANTTFGFEAQLKVALARDVLNLAEQGGGPFVPMRKFMKDLPLRESRPKLVIWEIPERYLDDPDDNGSTRKSGS
jgi:alginate O-acetyltransferase complex protein AlgJ